VWIFGGRGTADFFPAALALFGLSLFWDKRQKPGILALAAFIFSIAIILKYHTAILLPLIWLEALTRPNIKYKETVLRMGAITAAVSIMPAIYVYAVQHRFGFWLISPAFQSTFRVNVTPSFVLTNFISYAGYLALLLLPLSLLPVWNHMRARSGAIKLFAVAAVLFLAGYGLIEPNGEMNFGPLDAYFNTRVVGGAFCLCAGLFFLVLIDGLSAIRADRETFRIFFCAALGITIFIGVLSFTRPAQRYLLFVLPLVYFFLAPALAGKKRVAAIVVALWVVINIYIMLNQYATGQAVAELTQKITDSGLIDVTDPGAIDGHIGNRFPVNTSRDKKYIVVAGKNPAQILFAESMPAPFVYRAYSVVPEGSVQNP
jgi:hypothetical protein